MLGSARTFGWSYDRADRVTGITYPDGEVVSYTYDAAWRQTSACRSWGGCYASQATYTALDQPAGRTLGNGLTQIWSYNNVLARLTGTRVGPDSTRFHQNYSYDLVGNVSTITDNVTTQTQTFSYDHRDRLTRGYTTGGTSGAYDESYSYSTIGNLLSKGSTSYTYPAPGSPRPHAPTSVGGSSYTYDNNGNLTSGSNRTYGWNADNQPTSITGPDGVSESYTYDADGERVTRTRGSTTIVYFEGLLEKELPSALPRLRRVGAAVLAAGFRRG